MSSWITIILCLFLLGCESPAERDVENLLSNDTEESVDLSTKNYFEDDYPQSFTKVSLRSDGFFYVPNSEEPLLSGFVHYVEQMKGFYSNVPYYSRGELFNGKKHGRWMGFLDELEDSKSYAEVLEYKDGVKHGEHKRWRAWAVSKYTAGKDFPYLSPWSISRTETKNYKEGILHGQYISYPVFNGWGVGIEKGNYAEGEKHGEWTATFEDSEQLNYRKTYNNGSLMKEEYWNSKGESKAP